MKTKILYFDQEDYNRKSFYANFRTKYDIQLCSCHEEIIRLLKDGDKYDIIFLDQLNPNSTGFEFLYKLNLNYEPVRIVITAYNNGRSLREAKRNGDIFDFQDKPWHPEEVEDIIYRAMNYIKYYNKL